MKKKDEPSDIETISIPQGKIHVIKHRCKGCQFCIEFCPKQVLELSKEHNAKGYHPPRVKNPDKCIACGLCMMLCPDFGIWCESDDQKEKKR